MTEAQKALLIFLAVRELENLKSIDNEIADRTDQIHELGVMIAAVEQEGQ